MRARRLKPSFFDNPDLAKCNPYSRLLFEGLWCYSDSYGRFKVQPERIRAKVFPYEPDLPIVDLIAELIAVTQIIIYPGENGVIFGAIPTAPEHFPQDSTKNLKERIPKPPKKVEVTQMITLLSETFGKLRPNSHMTIDILSIDIMRIEVLTPPKPPTGGREEPTEPTEFIPGKTKPYPELFEQVIEDLNAVTDKGFKHTSEESRRLITARWNQGFDLADFRHVHRVKAADWLKDPNRNQYLRPKTLYGTKFEGYRQQKMPHPMKGKVSDLTIKNLEATEGWENE